MWLVGPLGEFWFGEFGKVQNKRIHPLKDDASGTVDICWNNRTEATIITVVRGQNVTELAPVG